MMFNRWTKKWPKRQGLYWLYGFSTFPINDSEARRMRLVYIGDDLESHSLYGDAPMRLNDIDWSDEDELSWVAFAFNSTEERVLEVVCDKGPVFQLFKTCSVAPGVP